MCYFIIYDKSCKCIFNKFYNLVEYFFKIFLYSIFFMVFFFGIDIFIIIKMWLVYVKMGRVVGMSKVYMGRFIF